MKNRHFNGHFYKMWQFGVGLLCFPVSDDNMSFSPEWFNFGMLVLWIVMGFYMIGYSMFSQRW